MFLPVAALVGFFKVFIFLIGLLDDDDQMKFHHYHGFVGFFIILSRIGLFIYFLFGCINLQSKYIEVNKELKPECEKIRKPTDNFRHDLFQRFPNNNPRRFLLRCSLLLAAGGHVRDKDQRNAGHRDFPENGE